jgi:N-acetylneuraminic acid mutarotase
MAMKRACAHLLLIVLTGVLWAASEQEVELDPLPVPLTNNAVTSFNGPGGLQFASFMGITSGKTWKEVSNAAYSMLASSGKWHPLRSVPGTAGRLGATAVATKDQIFLLGGYVLDSQGAETTVSDVNVYDPIYDRWFRGKDIPTGVSAAIGGAYHDRYVYLIGGWSTSGPTQAVQVYDIEQSTWLAGTPTPGPAVFGHAGAIVGDTIIYVDGALKNNSGSPAYTASDECWMGKIDRKDPTKIQWTKLPPHPGTARFRIAAGGSAKDNKVYFAGGSLNPYDTTGLGFDGKPAEPSPMVFAFDLKANKWEVVHATVPVLTMDQRGLLVSNHYLLLFGGMAKERAVTAKVTLIPKQPDAH